MTPEEIMKLVTSKDGFIGHAMSIPHERQNKNISDLLCELLGRANLFPYEKPKFKNESGHILLNSLYLYSWYCFK